MACGPTVSVNAYKYPGWQEKHWQPELSVSRDLNSGMRSKPTSGNKKMLDTFKTNH